MTPTQLKHREALLARNDAALDRWPQRTGQDFIREMTEVVEELEALSREADTARGDQLERSRNWRFVGNVCFDLANAKDLDLLKRAADAYKKAEALLAGIDNTVEKMKLDYSYGHALFHLSDAKELTLLQEARRRYSSALEIARTKMPAGIESARTALANADRVIALLTQAEGLSRQIVELEKRKDAMDAEEAAQQEPVPDEAELCAQLLDVYKKEVDAGTVSETRQQALGPVISQLQSLLQSKPTDVAGMTTWRSRMTGLMASMSHLLADTSHSVPTVPVGSRADSVWKRFSALKLHLSQDLMRPHMGSEERFSGMELYKRCAYADTFLHQPGRNDDTVYSYEVDVLRQLACEVRAFSLRNHITLVSPVWASSPSPQDPNAVFLSGGDALSELLAEVCARKKLKFLAPAAPGEFASTRWDQLRVCCVALFDFTHYKRPAPDKPVDLAIAGSVAAVSYELGIALALGRAAIVMANEGQDLPFDVDITPVWLKGDGRNHTRLANAIDDAMYQLQRGGEESSSAATHTYLNERFSSPKNLIVQQSLKLIDAEVVRDPVKFRRFVEPIVGAVGADAPQMVFPAWPGNYPRLALRRCFHVTPYGPAKDAKCLVEGAPMAHRRDGGRHWAGKTMKIVAAACNMAKPPVEYVRGDQVLVPDIIRSIWDNLCQASHVVVDLTDLNPNVALELGIAHTLGRNVLLVNQDSKKGQFASIAKVRMHTYSVAGAPGLKPLRDALDRFFVSGAGSAAALMVPTFDSSTRNQNG
jgi:hypothetical protein